LGSNGLSNVDINCSVSAPCRRLQKSAIAVPSPVRLTECRKHLLRLEKDHLSARAEGLICQIPQWAMCVECIQGCTKQQ
jgi:hypothetical protein